MKKVVLFAGVLLSIPLFTETTWRNRKGNSRGHHSRLSFCCTHAVRAAAAQREPVVDVDMNYAPQPAQPERPGYYENNKGAYQSEAPESNPTQLFASGTDRVTIPATMRRVQQARQPQQNTPQDDWDNEDANDNRDYEYTIQQVIEACSATSSATFSATHKDTLSKITELTKKLALAERKAENEQLARAIANGARDRALERAQIAEAKLASLTQKPDTKPEPTSTTQTPATPKADSSNPKPADTQAPNDDKDKAKDNNDSETDGETKNASWSTSTKVILGGLTIGGVVLFIKSLPTLLGYCKQSNEDQSSLQDTYSSDTKNEDTDTFSDTDEDETSTDGDEEATTEQA